MDERKIYKSLFKQTKTVSYFYWKSVENIKKDESLLT